MSLLGKLLDRFSGRQTTGPKQTAGTVGYSAFSGVLFSEERDSRVIGQQRWITYNDLLVNCSIVAAGMRYFLNIVAQPQWKVVAADDSDAAKRAADLVEDCMYDMRRPWYRVVRRAALYRFYGFGFQEWTAKARSDGAIGMLDVAPRPQHTIDRWDVDMDQGGVLLGVTQRSPQTGAELYIPRAKLIYCVDDSLTDHPEGTGLLRHVLEPAQRLQRYEALEQTGFVTDLRGVPIVRAPLDYLGQQVQGGLMTQPEADARLLVMRSWVEDHLKSIHNGIMIDSDTYRSTDPGSTPSANKVWDVNLIQGGSVGLEEMNVAISRITYDIARVLGVEHLLLGSEGTGSLAMSKTKSHDFAVTVDSSLTEIAEVMRSDFVVPLCDLNGVPEEVRPDLTTEAIQHQDPTEITAALRDLATAGASMQPGDPAINEVRSLLGLSDQPDEDVEDALDASLLGRVPEVTTGEASPDIDVEEEAVQGEGAKAPEEGSEEQQAKAPTNKRRTRKRRQT